MSTTPTAALEMILGVTPLHIRIEAIARAELYRLHCWHQLDVNRGNSGHVVLWRRMVDENPLWIAPSDHMIPTILPNHSYRVIIPDREAWQEGILLQLGADHVLFTDGSLCEGLAGAGVYSASLGVDLSFRLGRNVTVFQAEVFAISALKKALRTPKLFFASTVSRRYCLFDRINSNRSWCLSASTHSTYCLVKTR
jgi:hypothetical protein